MKVLVIGGGSIGLRHLRNLQTLGVQDLAVVEPSTARWEVLRETCGDQIFAGLAEGLAEKPAAVIVATPTGSHVETARACAAQGCHLFIEKPVSHSLDGLDELSAECAKAGLVTMVGCNLRFHPGPTAVKRLLTQGTIGQVISARIQTGSYLPDWRPQTDYRQSYSASTESGGVIFDCIHEIDLALWYFGAAELLAAAHLPASTIGLETDGVAELLLQHDLGILSSVHLNFIQRDYRRGCQIIGSEGTIYWDFTEKTVRVYTAKDQSWATLREPEGWETNQMYLDEFAHFLTCVREERATDNPIELAKEALAVALSARQPQWRSSAA